VGKADSSFQGTTGDISSSTEVITEEQSMTEEVVVEKSDGIPPPGDGQRIYQIDPMLEGHRTHLQHRLLSGFLLLKPAD
jgi:1,4-alpha-glucan branching enzyme